jgi:Zn-dependent metalloprotease
MQVRNQRRAWLVLTAVATGMAVPPAFAQEPRPPEQATASERDQEAEKLNLLGLSETARAAYERLQSQATEGPWKVTWSAPLKLVSRLKDSAGPAYPGSSTEAAEAFVWDFASLFGVDQEGAGLRHVSTQPYARKGEASGTVVKFEQLWHDLPVVEARMRLTLDQDNRVVECESSFWPVREVKPTPCLSASEALVIIHEVHGSSPGWPWREPTLAVLTQGHGRLVYLVARSHEDDEKALPWQYALDAHTGEVAYRREITLRRAGKTPRNLSDAHLLGEQSKRTGKPSASQVNESVRGAYERLLSDTVSGRWRTECNAETGLPYRLSGGESKAYSGSSEEVARAFLEEYAPLFALDNQDVSLELIRTHHAGRRGEFLTFSTHWRDLLVAEAEVNVGVTPQRRVYRVDSPAHRISDVDTEPTLTGEDALAIVGALHGPSPRWPWRAPTLAVYPSDEGRLVYLVHRSPESSTSESLPWEYAIAAHTGEIVRARDVMAHDDRYVPEAPTDGDTESRMPQGCRNGDPCAREWILHGPTGETAVTEVPAPADPFLVDIALGVSSFNADEWTRQDSAIYGAGITLFPCIKYTIKITWDLSTWDTHSQWYGYNDVFFVHVNSDGFYWDVTPQTGLSEHDCDTNFSATGLPPALDGPLWSFAGYEDFKEGAETRGRKRARSAFFTLSLPKHGRNW